MRHYDFQRLADAARVEPHILAKRLGLSGSTWKQYRDQGMSEKVADRRAAQCGFVAWEVWPEMLQDALEDAAADKRAKKAETMRRYRENPAVRERKRQRDAVYRSEVREYQRKQRMARYYANREQELARTRERYWASKHDVKDVA